MILLHLIIGLILGKLTNNYLPFILGSIIPDIYHIYIILKHKLYKKNFLDSFLNEEKYNIKYKTPLMHSLFGLIICSIIFYFIIYNSLLTLYFALAYLLHLLLDWPDKDIKYYLYPLKIKFHGRLEIWSKTEQVLTIIGLLILIIVYL